MGTASKAISNTATDTGKTLEKIAPTPIADADFGVKHTSHAADYKAGIDQLGAAVKGMDGAWTGFAASLAGAGSTYGSTEDNNSSTFNNNKG
ncbi:hypothetical protein F0L68_06235 [Solihabitans fulvus]|uniref:Excreted virulence factor EspC, type VII ESX diderm n=1 Tax=Solihabitans fulvus TaxID=1892852 RepID=A0A5B2XMS9_9PSEU|nr:hypothetical protein [Solihabitans fulvus]KAA2264686.1 hypothetical protein F0L68_06235 [Solihabitans fulvus]